MAVQVKLYGASSTKVNAEQVMCLHGAAAYADCDHAMLATDGTLSSEALTVAEKLGIEIRRVPAGDDPSGGFVSDAHHVVVRQRLGTLRRTARGPRADPLARQTMQILEVDGSGVRRVTTGGTTQRIAIGTFRWVIDRLLAGEIVTRRDIHDRNARQVSSGVMLILSNVPLF